MRFCNGSCLDRCSISANRTLVALYSIETYIVSIFVELVGIISFIFYCLILGIVIRNYHKFNHAYIITVTCLGACDLLTLTLILFYVVPGTVLGYERWICDPTFTLGFIRVGIHITNAYITGTIGLVRVMAMTPRLMWMYHKLSSNLLLLAVFGMYFGLGFACISYLRFVMGVEMIPSEFGFYAVCTKHVCAQAIEAIILQPMNFGTYFNIIVTPVSYIYAYTSAKKLRRRLSSQPSVVRNQYTSRSLDKEVRLLVQFSIICISTAVVSFMGILMIVFIVPHFSRLNVWKFILFQMATVLNSSNAPYLYAIFNPTIRELLSIRPKYLRVLGLAGTESTPMKSSDPVSKYGN